MIKGGEVREKGERFSKTGYRLKARSRQLGNGKEIGCGAKGKEPQVFSNMIIWAPHKRTLIVQDIKFKNRHERHLPRRESEKNQGKEWSPDLFLKSELAPLIALRVCWRREKKAQTWWVAAL